MRRRLDADMAEDTPSSLRSMHIACARDGRMSVIQVGRGSPAPRTRRDAIWAESGVLGSIVLEYAGPSTTGAGRSDLGSASPKSAKTAESRGQEAAGWAMAAGGRLGPKRAVAETMRNNEEQSKSR